MRVATEAMLSTQAAGLVVSGKHYHVVSCLVPYKTTPAKMHGSLTICSNAMGHGLRHGTTGIVRATVLTTTARYIKAILGGRKPRKGRGYDCTQRTERNLA